MAKTYLESISHFSEAVREELIKWSTRTRFPQVPAELSFLRPGFVDLGFENLGLGDEEHKALLLAFCGDGVAVPGTPYKLRFTGMAMSTVVEPAQPHLGGDTRQGVYPARPLLLGRGHVPPAGRRRPYWKKDREERKMNVVDKIMAYEQGDLDEQDTLELFQELMDTGLAFSLQGHYGRTAAKKTL